MGCARCSTCGINYPVFKAVCEVKDCGERLSPIPNDEPDVDWGTRVRSMNDALVEANAAMDVVATDELRAHRVERFESLGFPDYAAALLADAKDAVGFPLWWGAVADVLGRGATHAQALRIYV